MRKAIEHLVIGTYMFCFLWTLASCSHEAEDTEMQPNGEMTLGLGFKVPSRTVTYGSDDSDGSYYEEGETYENYIDVANGNYRIYFFDTNNNLIARFEPYGFVATEGSNYTQYNVLGKAPKSLVKYNSFKMVVLANWPHYPEDSDINVTMQEGTTTIADICNAAWAQYDCPTDGKTAPTSVALNPDAKRLMPFYGVYTYSDITFRPGQATILSEPVTLLRAMAKVEVILETDDYFNLSFRSLKINRYNTKGHCAPENVFTQSDYDHNGDWTEDYAATLHLADGKNDDEEKELDCRRVRRWNEGKKLYEMWTAYLPEYQNIGAGNAYSSIKAMFDIQLADDTPHTIYFANYSGGKTDNKNDSRLNIKRNNIYRFHVKCIGYDFKLKLTVSNWDGLYENYFEFGNGQIVSPVSPWEDEISNEIEY